VDCSAFDREALDQSIMPITPSPFYIASRICSVPLAF